MNYKKILTHFSLGILLGIGLFYISFQTYSYYNYHQNLHTQLDYWKKVAANHPEYPDSWIKLAEIWYNLDQDYLAELAIKKAKKLDPINEKFRNIY